MLQLNVSQASTICRASGRAMRSLGIWCGRARFASSRKTFLFLGPEKKITLEASGNDGQTRSSWLRQVPQTRSAPRVCFPLTGSYFARPARPPARPALHAPPHRRRIASP
jgi:hypothetical protein